MMDASSTQEQSKGSATNTNSSSVSGTTTTPAPAVDSSVTPATVQQSDTNATMNATSTPTATPTTTAAAPQNHTASGAGAAAVVAGAAGSPPASRKRASPGADAQGGVTAAAPRAREEGVAQANAVTQAAVPPTATVTSASASASASSVTTSASASSASSKKQRLDGTAAIAVDDFTPTFADCTQGKCSYCMKDVSNLPRVLCVDCEDKFVLCANCLAGGVELLPHVKSHRYRVMDNWGLPLFVPDWTANDELRMLDGIDMFGFGNWRAIAEHIGTKSAPAVQQHYMQYYVNSTCAPVPDLSKCLPRKRGRRKAAAATSSTSASEPAAPTPAATATTTAATTVQQPPPEAKAAAGSSGASAATASSPATSGAASATATPTPAATTQPAATATATATAPADADVVMVDAPTSATPQQATATASSSSSPPKGDGKTATTPGAATDLPPKPTTVLEGYMPLRGDFEVLPEEDAELVISDMEFSTDDHPAEVELKLKILEIYNLKLDERERRKQFVLSRGLVDFKRQAAIEKRRTPAEREVHALMRPFARFHSEEAHNQLVQGILAERDLRDRIKQLQKYRRLGIQTLAEGEAYDMAERRRAEEQTSARKRQRQNASYLSRQVTSNTARDRSMRYRQRASAGGVPSKRASGASTPTGASTLQTPTSMGPPAVEQATGGAGTGAGAGADTAAAASSTPSKAAQPAASTPAASAASVAAASTPAGMSTAAATPGSASGSTPAAAMVTPAAASTTLAQQQASSASDTAAVHAASTNDAVMMNGDAVMAAQVSIGDAPRATELSPQELTLCASLQLLPGHYLRLKAALLAEGVRRGTIATDPASGNVLVKHSTVAVDGADVSATQRRAVYDFVVSCGWVRTEPMVPTMPPPDTAAATTAM